MSRFRPRLTYANVVASVALFAALGGGAYATHSHKIGTKDLRNNAVKAKKIASGAVATAKLKNNAVRPAKIANGAVTEAKLADGLLDGLEGPQGPAGPQGPPGQQGPQGPAGSPGTLSVVKRDSGLQVASAGAVNDTTVNCQPGEIAIAGGATNNRADTHISQSNPVPTTSGSTPTGWRVRSWNDSFQHAQTVFVLCASP